MRGKLATYIRNQPRILKYPATVGLYIGRNLRCQGVALVLSSSSDEFYTRAEAQRLTAFVNYQA
ncbi:MAG: hypothetical protein JOZ31_23265 [Verrucomicrobia bacterium]|nr:hypothetical protein [Verrucomicrobiota bacterium]MBV8482834.1 hypothetical protein [Verrucomicrobiota bacterium]